MINEEHIVKISLENKIEYKIYLPLKESDYISKSIYESKKPYEYEMLKDMLDRMNENEVFIDIGANLGNHSLFMAAHGFKVYAFEPNEELCKMLETSIKLNGFEERIILHKIALGEGEARAKFKEQMPHNLGGQSLELTAEQRGGGIEVKALDTFEIKEKIGIIKIDVEGMESAVLKGAREIIQRDKPLLYVEAINLPSYKVIDKLLFSYSYLCFDTFNATPTHLYMYKDKLKENEMISKVLSVLTENSYKMRQNLNYQKQEVELLNELKTQDKQELIALNSELKSIKNNLSILQDKYQKALLELNQEKQAKQHIQNTLSFRWGNRIVKAKSLSKILKLPHSLYKEYQDFKKQKLRTNPNFTTPKIKDVSNTLKIFDKLNITELKELKIACIMDEFSYQCFKEEANFFQLSPYTFKEDIQNFKPNFVFIESAWEGKDKAWAMKISNCSQELVEMIEFCKEKNIPTIFWNKEDPVHFYNFLAVAQKTDFVFTTDIDMIPQYKYYVGHTNVYCLPFAANPKIHNPIELYERKDSFNFAGSYYARYPQRQRDFENLTQSILKFKKLSIYDRNYERNHSNYLFPKKYKPYILGCLPFNEIDKAYKGYEFALTMNTVKHSQTMFARRALELMACNTLVVSNYSRALRNFFGDLVVSSDDEKELEKRISLLISDSFRSKKIKLKALRKVLSEHSYAKRLEFIASVIFKEAPRLKEKYVYIYAKAQNIKEAEFIVQNYTRQSYHCKKLILHKDFNEEFEPNDETIKIYTSLDECIKELSSLDDGFLAGFNSKDYYASNYLFDFILASKYSTYDHFGKEAFYEFKDNDLILHNENSSYRESEKFSIYRGLSKIESIKDFKNFIENENISLVNLNIDPFSYLKNGAFANEEQREMVNDISLSDEGFDFKSLVLNLSPKFPALCEQVNLPKDSFFMSSISVFENIEKPTSSKLELKLENDLLIINSKLKDTEHKYLFFTQKKDRADFNMIENSHFFLKCEYNLSSLESVFEFYDEVGEKISHSINTANQLQALIIPSNCTQIRFGIRIKGSGKACINYLLLEDLHVEPYVLLGKSKSIILTKQYPNYDDIYKYGFLHSRVKSYKKEGFLVDILKCQTDLRYKSFEFEDIDVSEASLQVLKRSLEFGLYEQVIVHMLDKYMWEILKEFIDKVKVTVFIHGSEIQIWQRRAFNLEGLDEKEVQRQKSLSAQRVAFWQELIKQNHKNLHFVFVSEYFKNESLSDLGLTLPPSAYSIIHNYINTELFSYVPKDVQQRKKILSIRPFPQGRGKYANDLSVFAILQLSKRSFFDDLEFFIAGDGEFFDELTKPLRAFKNVKLQKAFFRQNEIAALHKEYGIFLVPTREDTQGVSRDEAMSSGLVPVTSRVAAVPEFVDEECGFLCEGENAKALADAIEFLYFNPDKFLEMSAKAAARVRGQSSFEHTIKKEIALIKGRVDE